MSDGSPETVHYQRCQFSADFPASCFYTRSHFWLLESGHGAWKIGLTPFATRMLGEIVEFDFEAQVDSEIQIGKRLGWIEGFKAVSELFSVARGKFLGPNPVAVEFPDRIFMDPCGAGWLYSVRGAPDPEAVDVNGYIFHLDRTIDTMQRPPTQRPPADFPETDPC